MNLHSSFVAIILSVLVGCAPSVSPASSESQRAVELQHSEVWSKGNLDLIPEIYAEDYVGHFPGGQTVTGRDEIRELVKSHRTSFPDWNEEILESIVEGDRIVTRYRSRGTHRGEFLGYPPKGKKVHVEEASVFHMVQGKIAEQWAFPDVVSLQNQISSAPDE